MRRTTMMITNSNKPHRILAPRLVFLIGTISPNGQQNIIPITNVTSVSTEPCQVLVAVYKPWQTCANLLTTEGFTLSLADRSQLELVWKLGAKYSGYDSGQVKTEEFRHNLDTAFSTYGPVLKGALGWMECKIVGRPDSDTSNHQMIVGQCTKAAVDPHKFTADITPIGTPKPLMQWERNHFSSAETIFSIAYYHDSNL